MILQETAYDGRQQPGAERRSGARVDRASSDDEFRTVTAHLLGVATDGGLHLVSRRAIEGMWLGQGPAFRLRSQEDIRRFRRAARTLAAVVGLGAERARLFGACAAEAAANAVSHGGGGYGVLDSSPEWCRFRVSDCGRGIPLAALLPAVLRRTPNDPVQPITGLPCLVQSGGTIYVATDTRGTVLILEAARKPDSARQAERHT